MRRETVINSDPSLLADRQMWTTRISELVPDSPNSAAGEEPSC